MGYNDCILHKMKRALFLFTNPERFINLSFIEKQEALVVAYIYQYSTCLKPTVRRRYNYLMNTKPWRRNSVIMEICDVSDVSCLCVVVFN